jgi:hypothetical protein
MATKKITVRIKDEPVELTLRSSKVDDGLWRGELIAQAVQARENETQRRSVAGIVIYPNCVPAVKEPDWVREMSLDDFINDVEEQDANTWMDAAYELNPHWKNIYQAPDEEAEKKILPPSTGSSKSTKARKRHPISRP